jgi:hypothetical protein
LVQVIEAFIKSGPARTRPGAKPTPTPGAKRPNATWTTTTNSRHRRFRTHLTVIIEHEELARGLGGAIVTGFRIGPREIRRSARAFAIIPLLPVEGRRSAGCRGVTGYQRAALAARDCGCAHPGCPLAAKRGQSHHIIHWINFDNADLDNLVLLCRTHHHRRAAPATGQSKSATDRPNSPRRNGSIPNRKPDEKPHRCC